MTARDPVERFWESVDVRGPDECWMWMKATLPKGYGLFRERSYVRTYAHRFSYELAHGPIPEGLSVDHLCGSKGCVNPAHLDVCTQEENTRRHFRKMTVCQKGLHDMTEPDAWYLVTSRGTRRCRKCMEAATAARRHAALANDLLPG